MSDQPFIHPASDIETDVVIGDGTKIWAHTHVRRGASIGSDCVIGERVFVDSGVVIGDRAKVQNQAAIFAPATLGDGVFVGPGACLTNDLRPRAVNPDGTAKTAADWHATGVQVASGASVGAMVTVIAGVSIGEWALIGAGSVVVGDVAPHELVVGNPGRVIGHVCKCGDRLDDDLTCTCGRVYQVTDGVVGER